MSRLPLLVIALFLFALWIVGLLMRAPIWLTWLDGTGALLAFIIAGMYTTAPDNNRQWLTGVLAIGLFALWIGGLAAHATAALTWFTFLAACGAAVIAIGGNRPMVRKAR